MLCNHKICHKQDEADEISPIFQFEKIYFGVGFMHEMENIMITPKNTMLLSTNYINYNTNILQNAELQNVIYYQFKV